MVYMTYIRVRSRSIGKAITRLTEPGVFVKIIIQIVREVKADAKKVKEKKL